MNESSWNNEAVPIIMRIVATSQQHDKEVAAELLVEALEKYDHLQLLVACTSMIDALLDTLAKTNNVAKAEAIQKFGLLLAQLDAYGKSDL